MKKSKIDCDNCRFNELGAICYYMNKEQLNGLSNVSLTVSLIKYEELKDSEIEQYPTIAILEGIIGIQHLLANGRRSISVIFSPGDMIDLRQLDGHHAGTVIALSAAQLCLLSPTQFDRIVDKNKKVQRQLTENQRKQSHYAKDHAVDLSIKTPKERIASFILEIRDRFFDKDTTEIMLNIRRHDIADYMGMRPETVSRVLRQLERENLITLSNTNTIIINNDNDFSYLAMGDNPA